MIPGHEGQDGDFSRGKRFPGTLPDEPGGSLVVLLSAGTYGPTNVVKTPRRFQERTVFVQELMEVAQLVEQKEREFGHM
jgi:hypothetical protein